MQPQVILKQGVNPQPSVALKWQPPSAEEEALIPKTGPAEALTYGVIGAPAGVAGATAATAFNVLQEVATEDIRSKLPEGRAYDYLAMILGMGGSLVAGGAPGLLLRRPKTSTGKLTTQEIRESFAKNRELKQTEEQPPVTLKSAEPAKTQEAPYEHRGEIRKLVVEPIKPTAKEQTPLELKYSIEDEINKIEDEILEVPGKNVKDIQEQKNTIGSDLHKLYEQLDEVSKEVGEEPFALRQETAVQPETARSEKTIQTEIDNIMTDLFKQGKNPIRMYDPTEAYGGRLLSQDDFPPGWEPMPDNLAKLYRERNAIYKQETDNFIDKIIQDSNVNPKETEKALEDLGFHKNQYASVTQEYIDGWGRSVQYNISKLYNTLKPENKPFVEFIWGGTGDNPQLESRNLEGATDIRLDKDTLTKVQKIYNAIAQNIGSKNIDLFKGTGIRIASESTQEAPFTLTPDETLPPPKPKSPEPQSEMFKGSDVMQTGTKPLIAEEPKEFFAPPDTSIQEEIPLSQPKVKLKPSGLIFNPETDSLADFVKKSGGLSTEKEMMKGEIRDRFSIKEGYNLVNNKTGKTLDDMRQMAQEEGFIQEGTSVSDFLDLLRQDVDNKLQGKADRVWSSSKQNYEQAVPSGIADMGGYKGLPPAPAIIPTAKIAGSEVYSPISKVDLPELVEIAKGLTKGKYPKVIERLRAGGGQALGLFRPKGTGQIELKAEIFKEPEMAKRVLGHEIGHLVDYVPENTMARGNIIGRLKSLKKYLRNTFNDTITNKDLRIELEALSQEWKPFDESDLKFKKYRFSSKELYGDTLSVLFNDPVLLQEKAPKFYTRFFKYIDSKPEVKKLYEELQDSIHSGNINTKRVENLRESFRKGEDAYALKLKKESRLGDKFKSEFIDVDSRLIDLVRKTPGLDPRDNPVYSLENYRYAGSSKTLYVQDQYEDVIKILEGDSLSWADFGEFLYHQRVVGERSKLANPQGWYPELSQARLDEMRGSLPRRGKDTLDMAAKEFWRIRNEHIISLLDEINPFTPELTEKLRSNKDYVTFDVVKYIEDRYGTGISPKIYKQTGTLEDISNPATATLMKDLSLISSLNRQKAISKTVNFLERYHPSEITPADAKWNGKAQVPVPSRNPDKDLIISMEGGEAKGYYVDKFIGQSFETNPEEALLLARILNSTSKPFKVVFTELNYGFYAFNAVRDYMRTVKNVPGLTMTNFIPKYLKSVPKAYKSIFDVPEQTGREMMKGNMLISVADSRGLRPEDTQLERLLVRYHASEKTWGHSIIKPVNNFLRHIADIGRVIERTPKIATYEHLKDRYPKEEVAHIIRGEAGSPDFLRKGKAYPIYNNFLLFSNAIKEGYRGDISAVRRSPAEYTWKQTKYTIIPKLLIYGAGAGILGHEIKKVVDGMSEYDKTNYIPIPVGLTPNGKSVYFRIPEDETSRLIGGLFWKVLNFREAKDFTELFDYSAGQFPTINPAIDIAADSIQYLSGRNPYDSFRGRYAIPDLTFQVHDERTHTAMLKYLANKSGAGIIHRFNTEDLPGVKTELEKILGYPISSNILGRFLKVSDQGIRKEYKDVKEDVRTKRARESLDAREVINKMVLGKGEITKSDIEALAKKNINSMEFAMIKGLTKRHGDLFLNELLSSESNEEKAAVIKKYVELKRR